MVISVLLFFCMSGCCLAATKLCLEFRRLRTESRMGRAIRIAFID
jgi:hypothetical protein